MTNRLNLNSSEVKYYLTKTITQKFIVEICNNLFTSTHNTYSKFPISGHLLTRILLLEQELNC